MSSLHFYVRINSKSFPWAVRCAPERDLRKFSAASVVPYCPIVAAVLVRPRAIDMALLRPNERYVKESRMNWKLKVSNTADNVGITKSQARDTRYRRMQKLNS